MIFCHFLVVTIPRTKKTESGKRVYDKVQYCLYCQEDFGNLGRHLKTCKKADKDMVRALSDPETSKAAKDKLFLELRGRGNFYHNMKVTDHTLDLVLVF